MRVALLCLLAVAACKKGPKETLPPMPDSGERHSQATLDLPQAKVFNHLWRYSGHAGQALAFYKKPAEAMGAHLVGETYQDDNLVHVGGFGMEGSTTPKDPTRAGVFIEVTETPNETMVDVWESVPKSP
jgi:hypothetical protein